MCDDNIVPFSPGELFGGALLDLSSTESVTYNETANHSIITTNNTKTPAAARQSRKKSSPFNSSKFSIPATHDRCCCDLSCSIRNHNNNDSDTFNFIEAAAPLPETIAEIVSPLPTVPTQSPSYSAITNGIPMMTTATTAITRSTKRKRDTAVVKNEDDSDFEYTPSSSFSANAATSKRRRHLAPAAAAAAAATAASARHQSPAAPKSEARICAWSQDRTKVGVALRAPVRVQLRFETPAHANKQQQLCLKPQENDNVNQCVFDLCQSGISIGTLRCSLYGHSKEQQTLVHLCSKCAHKGKVLDCAKEEVAQQADGFFDVQFNMNEQSSHSDSYVGGAGDNVGGRRK
jgi:hypothetical protein